MQSNENKNHPAGQTSDSKFKLRKCNTGLLNEMTPERFSLSDFAS